MWSFYRSGNAQFLAGMDQVRIADLVLVGLEDRRPASPYMAYAMSLKVSPDFTT
jgi:hypothetical protein